MKSAKEQGLDQTTWTEEYSDYVRDSVRWLDAQGDVHRGQVMAVNKETGTLRVKEWILQTNKPGDTHYLTWETKMEFL